MATAAGFKIPEMNWDATNLQDELAKFKIYCDLIFSSSGHMAEGVMSLYKLFACLCVFAYSSSSSSLHNMMF